MRSDAEKTDTVCVFFGPPHDPVQDEAAFSRFFAENAVHVVCGGTTARLAAAHLGTQIRTNLSFPEDGLPPVGFLEGAELVTEGILTMNRTLALFEEGAPAHPDRESGAEKLHALLHGAQTVRFYVGCAVNPSQQDERLPIPCRDKLLIVQKISDILKKLGKETEIAVF